jgi:GntR family transcriptional regulator
MICGVAFLHCSSILVHEMKFALDLHSGVPVYRQIIDRVHSARAAGHLREGDRLPTVRQLAVDLSVNPNTVVRAYRELELTGILTTHQGTGTFVASQKVEHSDAERERRLDQLMAEFVARAGREGFTVADLRRRLKEFTAGQ